jgi:hypothetical protein
MIDHTVKPIVMDLQGNGFSGTQIKVIPKWELGKITSVMKGTALSRGMISVLINYVTPPTKDCGRSEIRR